MTEFLVHKLECFGNGRVVFDVELERSEYTLGIGDFSPQFFGGGIGLAERAAGEDNSICYFRGGLEEGFYGFKADTGVSACDEDDGVAW